MLIPLAFTAPPLAQQYSPASSRRLRAAIEQRIILHTIRKLMLSRCVLRRPDIQLWVQENCSITLPEQLISGDGTTSFSGTNLSASVDGLSTRGPRKLLFLIPFLPVSTIKDRILPAECFWNGPPSQMSRRRKWLTRSASTGLLTSSTKSTRSLFFSELASMHLTTRITVPKSITTFTMPKALGCLLSGKMILTTSRKKYAKSRPPARKLSRNSIR